MTSFNPDGQRVAVIGATGAVGTEMVKVLHDRRYPVKELRLLASARSADPRYGLTPGTSGFCNALDDLLAHAQWWLHGHLHCPQDYVVHGCRVVANTLGYAAKGEQASFSERYTIDLASGRIAR